MDQQRSITEPRSSLDYTSEEQRLNKALIDAGLVRDIKPRNRVSKIDRPLGIVEGKPLSETIIDERR